MKKKLIFWLCGLMVMNFGCQHRFLKKEQSAPTSGQTVVTASPDSSSQEESNVPAVSLPAPTEYAIILGPGSARTFAHAGVLRELNRAGLPIKWIVGLEKASLAAFLYAENPDPFQVEWAFFKWKDLNLNAKDEVLVQVKKQFKSNKLDQFRLSAACASYSALQGKTYFYQKGDLLSAFEMCYFGFDENPKALGHAHVIYLRPLIQRALQQGLKVIYIDVLSDIRSISESSEQTYLWGLWKESISQQLESFPEVIIIQPKLQGPIENKGLRTDWIKRGVEATQQWLKANP